MTSRTASVLLLSCLGLWSPAAVAAPAGDPGSPPRPAPRPPDVQRPEPATGEPTSPEPKADPAQADRHFKAGVALFKEARYEQALAEFERAYAIAPHPLVLYNIAGCHRELAHFAQAATSYRRFLAEGEGKVAAARLSAARAELDAILPLVASLTVIVAPASGAVVLVDGAPLDQPTAPVILAPGEHRVIARANGRRDAEKTVRVAAGDHLTVELALGELSAAPAASPAQPLAAEAADHGAPARATPAGRRFSASAGFGANLRLLSNTGAPSLGVAFAISSRVELGLDAVLVAYAVVPSVRIRVAGDALALHVIGAVPYALNDGSRSERFAAGALGLGVRYRPLPGLAVRLESYVAFAGAAHGMSIPIFLGGERWF